MKRRAVFALLLFAGLAAASTIDDIVGRVSQASYRNYLDNQLYARTGDNRGLTGGDHDPARDNIEGFFLSFGLTTSLDPFTYSGATYYNVVGILPGADSTVGTYIVGAHYDSASNPGADDNASGVAAILEAARVLSQYSFASTLIFIAFDREEEGLKGSQAYATAHAHDNIRGMVSVDMIGFNGTPGSTAAIHGRAASAPIKSELQDAVETWGGLNTVLGTSLDLRSDQRYFEDKGFQAALLTQGGYLSNPYYHKATDSVDTGFIDYAYATSMMRSVVGWMADEGRAIPEPAAGFCIVTGLFVIFYKARRGYGLARLSFQAVHRRH
jgi:hypothetical protein